MPSKGVSHRKSQKKARRNAAHYTSKQGEADSEGILRVGRVKR